MILVIPYFGYSTMERAAKPGEVVTAKTIARQLSAMPKASRGNWVLLMDLHSTGIVYYFEGDIVTLELYAESKVLEAIRGLRLPDLCLASTDMGRAKWVEALANRLEARREWPANLYACRSLPEVKALREAVQTDATPALAPSK